MKYLAAIIILGFIAIGVFGFAGFNSSHNNAFMQCAESLMGHDCSGNSDMGLIHSKIYQSFSLAILVLTSLFATLFIVISSLNSLRFELALRPIEASLEPKKRKFISWYTTLQKRDPLV